jgi:hypothetical protein
MISQINVCDDGVCISNICDYCKTIFRTGDTLCLPCKGLFHKGLLVKHKGHFIKYDSVEKYDANMSNQKHDGKSVSDDPEWNLLSVSERGDIKTYMYASRNGRKIRKEVFENDLLVESTLS